MGQHVAVGTGLSSSLRNWLDRIETEQAGAQLTISTNRKAEAQAALAAVEASLVQADEARVLRWVAALGTLSASRPDEADAATKARAYATMLEFPASAFSKASLESAARKFRWFPSFAELCEFLEAEVADAKRIRHQLRRAIALPVVDREPAGRWSEMTAEQRAEFERIMAGYRTSRGPLPAKAENPVEDESEDPPARVA